MYIFFIYYSKAKSLSGFYFWKITLYYKLILPPFINEEDYPFNWAPQIPPSWKPYLWTKIRFSYLPFIWYVYIFIFIYYIFYIFIELLSCIVRFYLFSIVGIFYSYIFSKYLIRISNGLSRIISYTFCLRY